jgi:hypothetical protein
MVVQTVVYDAADVVYVAADRRRVRCPGPFMLAGLSSVVARTVVYGVPDFRPWFTVRQTVVYAVWTVV